MGVLPDDQCFVAVAGLQAVHVLSPPLCIAVYSRLRSAPHQHDLTHTAMQVSNAVCIIAWVWTASDDSPHEERSTVRG